MLERRQMRHCSSENREWKRTNNQQRVGAVVGVSSSSQRRKAAFLGFGKGWCRHSKVVGQVTAHDSRSFLVRFCLPRVSKVSLNKSNLISALSTSGSAGGLHFPLLGFLGYNDYLGFEDGVPKGSDEGTSGTKDGDLISNETVVANVQNTTVDNFETVAAKGTGAATRGHSTVPVNEDTLTSANSEIETVQGISNPPNEKSGSSKDGLAMQAENLLGESEVVGNISHDVDLGKSVGDENGKKHSKLGINISPPSRDQPRGKGGELKVGQGANPIKGILKNPNRYGALAEQGGKGVGNERSSKNGAS
ncbi:hypothetical protein L6452_15244 [Arctium lappa]|uniref:Uncharacterized protein n=1 Tax=Arctium lappa TaxID=4217 RepID=A0ACB9CN32_ARCLA|nr:hypothetical protein L6452_15244 [Arctium lappa]